MSIYSLTLTNPGAESGSTTGWTSRSGGAPSFTTLPGGNPPHSGSYAFVGSASGATAKWDQQVDVSAYAAAIDANTAAVDARVWQSSIDSDNDRGGLYVEFYDGTTTLISSVALAQTEPDTWTRRQIITAIPVNTRYVRIGTDNTRTGGTQLSTYWDDFSIDLSDNRASDWPYEFGSAVAAFQVGVYGLAQAPADEAHDYQQGVYSLGAAETSNTFHDVNAYQLGVYALVKGLADRRDLRAWTFTQDDHDFYVLQLGDESTLVYDKLSGQWAQWTSPSFVYWRGQDGCDWEGYNLACDTETGKIWEIDAEGRLDYGTTSIRSQVTGQITDRFRNFVNCYMAELAVSEAQPPASIDPSTVGITLRTVDSNGLNSVTHGEVTGEAVGDDITVRWYGLGLMQAPGRVFEITDTGYARRIDGLNLEIGNGPK